MTRIETTVDVPSDRRLVLDLPDSAPVGPCDVIVFISRAAAASSNQAVEPDQADEIVDGTPLRREGSVLVYAGVSERSDEDPVARMREERIQGFIRQATGG